MSEGFSFEGGKGYHRVFRWKGGGSDAANRI